ncbi:hypothetical protein RAA17_09350 [Komagataeibacter rhaeticus]|nr:hypothetical protein [Komagataeibacter rhaeticus]
MSKKSFRQAINEALRQEMRRDPTVILMGRMWPGPWRLRWCYGCLGRCAGCDQGTV